MTRPNRVRGSFSLPSSLPIYDGLVKSRKTDFLPQHIGIMQDDNTICCGQNKMLGLFTRPSIYNSYKVSAHTEILLSHPFFLLCPNQASIFRLLLKVSWRSSTIVLSNHQLIHHPSSN